MKWWLFLTCCMALLHPVEDEKSDMRNDFYEIDSEQEVYVFLEHYAISDCYTCTPYIASVMMRRAEYASWPIRKLRYFKEGRQVLEDYIAAHPGDIEARYVRILVQSSIPDILGYNGDIAQDLSMVRDGLAQLRISEDDRARMREVLTTLP